jgi:hypothetical protein
LKQELRFWAWLLRWSCPSWLNFSPLELNFDQKWEPNIPSPRSPRVDMLSFRSHSWLTKNETDLLLVLTCLFANCIRPRSKNENDEIARIETYGERRKQVVFRSVRMMFPCQQATNHSFTFLQTNPRILLSKSISSISYKFQIMCQPVHEIWCALRTT